MCLCSRCIDKVGGLEYPSAPPRNIVRLRTVGMEHSAATRDADIVINSVGTVLKDRHGEAPRDATPDELRQAVEL